MDEQDLSKMSFKRHKSPDIDMSSLESIWADDASEKLKGYADILTTGLSSDDGNFVLNVNGAWGSGKTFFIERWVAYLEKKDYAVVNFNAWKNDCCSDPFITLIATFLNQIPALDKTLKAGFVKTAQNLVDGSFNLLVNGIAERCGFKGTLDEAKKDFSDIRKNDKAFIQPSEIEREMQKVELVKKFEAELNELVKKIVKPSKPIIIFVDELDRCRPTFAIELLERIKHLFDIDGIKFVVVSDTTQLCASIKKVYGAGFDSQTYLRRFFDQTFELKHNIYLEFATKLFGSCEAYAKNKNGVYFGEIRYINDIINEFTFIAESFNLSLRDMEQVEQQMRIAFNLASPHAGNEIHELRKEMNFELFAFLAILRSKNLKEYKELIESQKETKSNSISTLWSKIKLKYFKSPKTHESTYLVWDIGRYFGECDDTLFEIDNERREFIETRFIPYNANKAEIYSEILELSNYAK